MQVHAAGIREPHPPKYLTQLVNPFGKLRSDVTPVIHNLKPENLRCQVLRIETSPTGSVAHTFPPYTLQLGLGGAAL